MINNNPFRFLNPYVSTLIEGISKKHNTFDWGYGLEPFWTEEIESYDLIHIHWPHMIAETFGTIRNVEDVQKRIKFLKSKGIKIITTCHNFEPHYSSNNNAKELYRIFYSNSNAIIHLGQYSLELFKTKYPDSYNILIPHHVYDTVYTNQISKETSLKKLHLNTNKKYILCFGAFRHKTERDFIIKLSNELKSDNIKILAPSFYTVVPQKSYIKYLLLNLKFNIYRIIYNNIYMEKSNVSDDRLPYFFGASSVSLIHRPYILNSGNVPLGFLFGNIIVGPNVGNVGNILNETGNLTFSPDDFTSIIKSIKLAFSPEYYNKGLENRSFALNNYSTDIVSERIYKLYNKVINN